MQYIDFHCDTLMMFGRPKPQSQIMTEPNSQIASAEGANVTPAPTLYQNDHMVDFVRMKKGGCAAQFFATFMPPRRWSEGMTDEIYRQRLYAGLMGELQVHSDIIAFARNYEEYKANREKGLMSAFLTFEDGRMVEGSHDKLKEYYDLGYRLISFTWNGANCFGFPNSSDPIEMQKGLTTFGFEAVEHMNQLGMIIDVSHLSDGGFYDVAKTTKKPFVASHSNSRAMTPHQRNLTDDQIRLLAEKGGFMGINFAPEFIGETVESTDSTVARICDHIEHIVKVGGIEVVGLGSDWDGIGGNLEVGSPLDVYKIYDELAKRGFGAANIEKFAIGNAERVLREAL